MKRGFTRDFFTEICDFSTINNNVGFELFDITDKICERKLEKLGLEVRTLSVKQQLTYLMDKCLEL